MWPTPIKLLQKFGEVLSKEHTDPNMIPLFDFWGEVRRAHSSNRSYSLVVKLSVGIIAN